MNIGIYAPGLNVYGGGEKYICKIAEILSEKNHVEFIVFESPNINELESRLNVDLSRIYINKIKEKSIFSKTPLKVLAREYFIKNSTQKYELFIYQMRYPTPPRSHSKRSVLMYEVPRVKKNLIYFLYHIPIANLFLDFKLKTYQIKIANSHFTKKFVEKDITDNVQVLYPPIDINFKLANNIYKKNILLSVGRFFQTGHSKKQLDMIKIFKLMHDKNNYQNWEYHLVGGVGSEKYFQKCVHEAEGHPIFFHPNTPRKNLDELYAKSKIFWHATGFRDDANIHPERMEHFGISTVEAMSFGCVPVVINKGGQPEIINNGIDGFLWDTPEELIKYTIELTNDESLWKKMSLLAIKRSNEFGIDVFRDDLQKILCCE